MAWMTAAAAVRMCACACESDGECECECEGEGECEGERCSMAGSAHHHGCRCKLKRLKGVSGGGEGTRGLGNARVPPSKARALGAPATWEGVRHDSAR